jgi:hypothetical protein
MNKLLIYFASLLILATATALAVSAQESNVTADAAVNNTTITSISAEAEAPQISNNSAINLSTAKEATQNLSTADSSVVAPISQMALPAPSLAAGASSIQTAAPEEGSQKIGAVVNDINRTIVNPSESEPLELGLPTKPVKDVSTIFFVCDLV